MKITPQITHHKGFLIILNDYGLKKIWNCWGNFGMPITMAAILNSW